MKILRKLLLGLALLCPTLGSAQNGFFSDRAMGATVVPGAPRTTFSVFTPISYGQVRVCTSADIGTVATPCPHPASISDIFNNPLSISGGNFGQLTTDIAGRYSFQATPGSYWVQVAASASNTPQLNYAITIGAFAGISGVGSCGANQWVTALNFLAAPTCTQPAFSNISGVLTTAQEPSTTVNSVVNDTNVTGSIATQALTLGWTGTLAAGRLNSSVVQSVTNDTNVTGAISAQNLTLGWAGTLAKARTLATTVYTDQANTWGAFLQSFGGNVSITGSLGVTSLTTLSGGGSFTGTFTLNSNPPLPDIAWQPGTWSTVNGQSDPRSAAIQLVAGSSGSPLTGPTGSPIIAEITGNVGGTDPAAIKAYAFAAGTGSTTNVPAVHAVGQTNVTSTGAGAMGIMADGVVNIANGNVWAGNFNHFDHGFSGAATAGIEIDASLSAVGRGRFKNTSLLMSNQASTGDTTNDWAAYAIGYGKSFLCAPTSTAANPVCFFITKDGSAGTNNNTTVMSFEATQPGSFLIGIDFSNASFIDSAIKGATLRNTTFISSVNNNGSAFKQIRVTTGSIAASGFNDVVITWGTAFADTSYTAVCQVFETTGSTRQWEVISQTAAALTVRVFNLDAGAAHTGTVHCEAWHD